MSTRISAIATHGTIGLPKSILRVVAATTLLCLSARVEVPMQPVPFTLQVLALGVVVAIMGVREAVAVTLAYIVVGALGAPVFSGAMGGVAKLAGPTGGFIAGFVPAAALGSWLRGRLERTMLPAPAQALVAVLAATAVVYLFGWAQLMVVAHLSPTAAYAAGVAPFVVMDLLKALIAASVASMVRIARPSLG